MSKREAPSDDRESQRRAGVVRQLNSTQAEHVNAALNKLPRFAVSEFTNLATTAAQHEIKVTQDGGPVRLKTGFGSCKLFFPTKPDDTRGEFVITLSSVAAKNANAVTGVNGVIVRAMCNTKAFFPKKGFGDLPKLSPEERHKRIDMDLQSTKPAVMFKNPKVATLKAGTDHETQVVQYSIKLNFVVDGKPGPTETRIVEEHPDLLVAKHFESKRLNPMLDRIFYHADGKPIQFEELLPHLVVLPSSTFLPLEGACEVAIKGASVSEKYNRVVLSSFLNRCTVSGVPISVAANEPSEEETAEIDAIYASSSALATQ